MGDHRAQRPLRFAGTAAVLAALVVWALALASCSSGTSTQLPEPKPSPSAPKEGSSVFAITSPAFEAGGLIPAEYANTGYPGGQNVSIPYEWGGAPEGTASFALLLADRAPVARSWVHWLVTAIPADATELVRGVSGTATMPAGAIEHVNSFGKVGYGGPQPPAGTGKHEYEAVLYALDAGAAKVPERATLVEFTKAINGHVLATATYSGLLGR